jgi:hypothetical protein
MCCLVQGWSASTSTAQALSWWVVAKGWPAHLPGFVVVEEEPYRAVIAIVYDNIGVFCNDARYRKQIVGRLKTSCHDLHIVFKYSEATTNNFTFLGIQGAWGPYPPAPLSDPPADGTTTPRVFPKIPSDEPRNLFWRIIPDTFDKWSLCARTLLSRSCNAKEMMQLYGYISRFIHISNGDRCTRRHLTRLIADVARGLKTV